MTTPAILALILGAAQVHADNTVLRDDFANPASGWYDNGNRAERARGFATYTPSGKYQMSPVQGGTLGISLAPRQARGGNVLLESDVFMYAGIGNGAAGMVCRHQDGDNFYAFLVTGQPAWLILKVVDGKPTQLAGGPLPKAGVPGAVDTRVVAECVGGTLTMRVGGRAVGAARDAAFTHGSSGLMVMGESLAGTNAQFDDFALRDPGGAMAQHDAPRSEPVRTEPRRPVGGVVARIANGARDGRGERDADGRPGRAASLQPGEALVVVEHDGFQGKAVIGLYANGRLKLLEQFDSARSGSLNLQVTLSGDSAYANLRTGSTASSQIANWNVKFDAASQSVRCTRMDIYPRKLGVLTLWNYKGERLCLIR